MVLFERHVLHIKNFILPYCAWCQGESINYYWVYACSGSGLASDCEIEGTVCRDQWQIQGRDPGGPPFLIFRPNWGPKGRKKFFGDRPPAPLSQFLDDQPPHQLSPPPPSSYLKAWIRLWEWRVWTFLNNGSFKCGYCFSLCQFWRNKLISKSKTRGGVIIIHHSVTLIISNFISSHRAFL